MQASELFRRGIVLPRDKTSKLSLEGNQAYQGIATEALLFRDEDHFLSVWRSGIFSDINALCSAHIDDYEEEEVTAECLARIIELLDEKYLKTTDADLGQFYARLRRLCAEGVKLNMPLFFIL